MNKELHIELDTFCIKIDNVKRNKKALKERNKKAKKASSKELDMDRITANCYGGRD